MLGEVLGGFSRAGDDDVFHVGGEISFHARNLEDFARAQEIRQRIHGDGDDRALGVERIFQDRAMLAAQTELQQAGEERIEEIAMGGVEDGAQESRHGDGFAFGQSEVRGFRVAAHRAIGSGCERVDQRNGIGAMRLVLEAADGDIGVEAGRGDGENDELGRHGGEEG